MSSKINKKNIRKTIRFSTEEYEQITSNLNGKSFSNFARELLINGKVKVSRIKKADPALLYQLNKIGNNLNQIAHKVNVEGCENDILILDSLRNIERALEEIKDAK